MANQQQLSEAQERMIAEISPFQQRSNELLDRAIRQEVYDEQTLASAMAVKKQITSHRSRVKDVRLSITRQIDAVKKAILNVEGDVLYPLDTAQEKLGSKILAYEEEKERKRREEQERIEKLVQSVTVSDSDINHIKTIGMADKKLINLSGVYADMGSEDSNIPEVKAAFVTSKNRLVERKEFLQEQKRQKQKQAELDAKEQEIEEERERFKREQEEREAIERAENDRKRREARERDRVKTGARTYLNIEIHNPDAVPRMYCVPSEKLIREAVRNGKKIRGVRVTKERRV